MKNENVAILGASDKSDKYSYKAMLMLADRGHNVYLIHPTLDFIEGRKVYKNLSEIKEPIDTLTMYVNPKISSSLEKDILKLNPKRVIFNPGSENIDLEASLKKAGIFSEEACTLVLLTTQQY